MVQVLHKLTRHAAQRAAERSIPIEMIDMILTYGDSRDAGDGARKFALSRQSLREIKKDYADETRTRLDHFRRAYVVANGENIITAAFAHKPIFH